MISDGKYNYFNKSKPVCLENSLHACIIHPRDKTHSHNLVSNMHVASNNYREKSKIRISGNYATILMNTTSERKTKVYDFNRRSDKLELSQ